MPAVPRARRDSKGSADREPGAGPANGSRSSPGRLDSRVVEGPGGDSPGHADARVLAGLSEVRVPATERRCAGADSRHSRLPPDVPRRADTARGGDDENGELRAGKPGGQ